MAIKLILKVFITFTLMKTEAFSENMSKVFLISELISETSSPFEQLLHIKSVISTYWQIFVIQYQLLVYQLNSVTTIVDALKGIHTHTKNNIPFHDFTCAIVGCAEAK